MKMNLVVLKQIEDGEVVHQRILPDDSLSGEELILLISNEIERTPEEVREALIEGEEFETEDGLLVTAQFLKWTVEFCVSPMWVQDGFDLTDSRAVSMIRNELDLSTDDEVNAKVTAAPDAKMIRKLQGHND